MNAITPIWETRTPVNKGKTFEIIRNAQFPLEIPQLIKLANKKLIELVIRRWTASGFWLDFNLLGKGRTCDYPLNLPGVKAEEGWAEVLEALLKLCIVCHRYSTALRQSYFFPNHLWLAVINDLVQRDVNSALKGDQLKTATIKGNRNFISCLEKEKMPSLQDWGDCGDHSYRLFKTAVDLKKLRYKPIKFTEAFEKFIAQYKRDTTAYDHNDRAKAAFVEAEVLKVKIGKRSQATGWKTLQLPPLPREFWSSHQGVLVGEGHIGSGFQR